jgi:glucose-1-phosphatase
LISDSASRAIVFDLGKVLIDFDVTRACRQISSVSGVDTAKVSHFLFDLGWENRFERGEFGFPVFHEAFEKHFAIKAPIGALKNAAADIFTPVTATLRLLEELRRIHEGKTPMVLLSNTNEIHWEHIEANWNVSRHFDHLVLSFEERAMKPEARIYEKVLEKTGLAGHQCFFVDDVPANVNGALACGFDAVIFTGAAALREELAARGMIQASSHSAHDDL